MQENKRGKIIKTIGYYINFIILGSCLAVIGPTLPLLANHVGRPLTEMGIIFTAREIGIMFTALRGGRLYDRLPGHYIIPCALISAGILLAIVPVMTNIYLLIAVFMIMGSILGLVDIGGNTLLMWLHGKHVTSYMNGLHFFFGIGTAIAPIVAALVIKNTADVYWAYWIIAICSIPVALFLVRLPSPKPHHEEDEIQSSSKPNFHLIILVGLFLAMDVGMESGYGGWIASFVLVQNLASEADAAYFASVFWGAFTFGRLVGIPTAMRLSAEKILYFSMAISLICIVMLIVLPGNINIIWIGTCGLGFAIGPVFATIVAMMGRRMHMTGQITGWIFSGASCGAMLLPWLIGKTIGWYGPQAMIYCIGITALAATVLLFLIVNYKESTV